MSRATVGLDDLRGKLARRRADLEHNRTACDDDLELVAIAAGLDELDVVATLVEDLEPRVDVADTTRPGVLLIGAGTRGDVTVAADAEALNVELLSDRDLAVYPALLRYALDRLEREQVARTFGTVPRRYITGPGVLNLNLATTDLDEEPAR